MSETVRWISPNLPMRGCVIDGIVAADDDAALNSAFEEAWNHLASFVQEFELADSKLTIVVEVWQDTGRIIFIARRKRDVVRIALQCDAIERHYFSIIGNDEAEFAAAYQAKHHRLVELLRCSLKGSLPSAISVTDADDEGSAEIIR